MANLGHYGWLDFIPNMTKKGPQGRNWKSSIMDQNIF